MASILGEALSQQVVRTMHCRDFDLERGRPEAPLADALLTELIQTRKKLRVLEYAQCHGNEKATLTYLPDGSGIAEMIDRTRATRDIEQSTSSRTNTIKYMCETNA